jgi:hypothetical protein
MHVLEYTAHVLFVHGGRSLVEKLNALEGSVVHFATVPFSLVVEF